MKKIKSVHFTGIKGVGMTPLAIIARQAGIKVTGSDLPEEFITDASLKKAGINVSSGFAPADIGNPDLLITTGAHGGLNNPQVLEAQKRGIQVWTQGQAVGEFMSGEIFGREFRGISVAGSHGKTTVTAIIATILKESNLDPSYLIGTSEIASLGLPGHFGIGKYFVSEADEYATDPELDKTPKFMWQHPEIAVITNIELDHTDLYENVDELRKDFLKFINSLDEKTTVIVCGDDRESHKLIEEAKSKNITTYGFSASNDYVIEKFKEDNGRIYFWVSTKGTNLGEFVVGLSGEFNGLNSLAAIVASIEAGLTPSKIRESISKYQGSRRRFELIGKLESGAILYDDYAHHPTEINKTLKAFRNGFEKKKIVCIFQPHTFSRTKALLKDFIKAFSYADSVILTDIYSSLREEQDPSISSEILAREMSLVHNNVKYASNLADVVKYITQENFDDEFLLVTMGAGDIYKIKDKLEFQK